MKYVIHRLVTPQSVQKTEMVSVHKLITKRIVLETLDLQGINPVHETMEDAVNEIKTHSAGLKNMNLTIIPIILVDENGNLF